jgi:hypothetical protein
MKSRIRVAWAVVLLPAVLLCACGESTGGDPAGDRAFKWTVDRWGGETSGPELVEVLLLHPDIANLRDPDGSGLRPGYRAHGIVFLGNGDRVDVWGTWDVWGNFQAEGGGYSLDGTVVGETAYVTVAGNQGPRSGEASSIEPDLILGAISACHCQPVGKGTRCVKCGDQVVCCAPEPMNPGTAIIPGQGF